MTTLSAGAVRKVIVLGLLGLGLASAQPAAAEVFPSSDVPQDIGVPTVRTASPEATHPSLIESTIEIGVAGVVGGVELRDLRFSHGFAADMDVFLISPEGTSVELFTDVCGGSVWSNTDFGLSDIPGLPVIGDTCPPALNDIYRPEGDLSEFQGERMNGIWTLRVEDDFTGEDPPTLHGWQLQVSRQTGSEIEVLDAPVGTVRSVAVRSFSLAHNWAGDLQAFLRSPAGTTVELFSQVCGGTANQQIWTQANTGFSLRSAAGLDPIGAAVDGNGCPPGTGTYLPVQSLNALGGESANGTWELLIRDAFPAVDSGTLHGWSLEIANPPNTTIPTRNLEQVRRRITFSFGSDLQGVTFECSVGGAPFRACTSPFRLSNLNPGDSPRGRVYRMAVRAVDGVGNADPTPAVAEWRIVPWKRVEFKRVEGAKPIGKSIRFVKLLLKKVKPSNAKASVQCKGGSRRGCTFKQKTVKAKRGKVNLSKLFKRPLKRGAKITIIVSARNRVKQGVTYSIGNKDVDVKEFCIAPFSSQQQSCNKVR